MIRNNSSATAITISQLAGFWSFGASGSDAAANRCGSAGTFKASTTGAWTKVEIDSNDDGSTSHSTSFTGAFAFIDPITGRGTATLTVTNGPATHYSFYPVSTSEIIMLSTDPVSSTRHSNFSLLPCDHRRTTPTPRSTAPRSLRSRASAARMEARFRMDSWASSHLTVPVTFTFHRRKSWRIAQHSQLHR